MSVPNSSFPLTSLYILIIQVLLSTFGRTWTNDDDAGQKKISEIEPRGVMTGHPRRVWQRHPLEFSPGGDRQCRRTFLDFRIRTDGESDLSTVTSQPSQSVTCVQIHRSEGLVVGALVGKAMGSFRMLWD
jgi:hypothetical protein